MSTVRLEQLDQTDRRQSVVKTKIMFKVELILGSYEEAQC